MHLYSRIYHTDACKHINIYSTYNVFHSILDVFYFLSTSFNCHNILLLMQEEVFQKCIAYFFFAMDLLNSVFIQFSLPEGLNNNSIYALGYLFQMLAKKKKKALFSDNIIVSWGKLKKSPFLDPQVVSQCCFSLSSISVKRHHVYGNSHKRKLLGGTGLEFQRFSSIIIKVKSMAACRQMRCWRSSRAFYIQTCRQEEERDT